MSLVQRLRERKIVPTARVAKELAPVPSDVMGTILKTFVDQKFEQIREDIVKEVVSLVSSDIQELRPKKGIHYNDGRVGPKGADGQDGVRGPIGPRGLQGIQGDKGQDGSSDTPDEVVGKVNKSGRKVFQSSIEGLKDTIEEIRAAIQRSTARKGGGGGMGTPQHEQFSLTSGTTSVTLAYNVAFGGYGIMGAFVQGQFIARGTHYTVSGKTITLLFTPDNSTKLDVIYIRT